MKTTINATNHDCGHDGTDTAPAKTERRMGRLFMATILACVGVCLTAGTAAAASKEVTIITTVSNASQTSQKVVEAIKTGNIAALDAIFERGEWDIDAPLSGIGKPIDLLSGQVTLQYGSYYAPGGGWLYGTPLMYAALQGRVRLVKHLLELGANPNVMLQTGGVGLQTGQELTGIKRPFICALTDAYMLGKSFNGKTAERADKIGQMLIEAGAVLPPEDVWGRNALWDAAIARSPRLLNLCLESGLDPDEEDNVDRTVMDDIDATLSMVMPDTNFRESLFNFKRILEKSASEPQE